MNTAKQAITNKRISRLKGYSGYNQAYNTFSWITKEKDNGQCRVNQNSYTSIHLQNTFPISKSLGYLSN